MLLGFVLPDHWSRHVIAKTQAELDGMTEVQRAFAAHLIRSWKCDTVNDVRRAIRRAREER